jgi:hypothetical protein
MLHVRNTAVTLLFRPASPSQTAASPSRTAPWVSPTSSGATFPPSRPALLFSHIACSDWSFSSPATAADVVPSARANPFLHALTAVGAAVTQTAHGYTLCPSHSSVTLSYSTQTCDEFYRQRSASWPQDCDARQPLLSTIVTGATLLAAFPFYSSTLTQECRLMLRLRTPGAGMGGTHCDTRAAAVKHAHLLFKAQSAGNR